MAARTTVTSHWSTPRRIFEKECWVIRVIYIAKFHLIEGAIVVMIVWYLNFKLPMQSVIITNVVVTSNPVDCEVYWIQHCVIKFVSDLRQVSDFLRVLQFPPPIKLTATI